MKVFKYLLPNISLSEIRRIFHIMFLKWIVQYCLIIQLYTICYHTMTILVIVQNINHFDAESLDILLDCFTIIYAFQYWYITPCANFIWCLESLLTFLPLIVFRFQFYSFYKHKWQVVVASSILPDAPVFHPRMICSIYISCCLYTW